MELTTPLADVLHTTKEYLSVLKEMGLKTVNDLLLYLPRSHEDLSEVQTIASAPMETKVSIRGVVEKLRLFRSRSGKQIISAVFTDPEGSTVDILWFNQPHIKRMLKDGDEVVLTGKLSEKGMKLQMLGPTFELPGNRPLIHAGRLVPIYPQHDRITSKWLREKMVLIQDAIDLLPETLPASVRQQEKLLKRSDAIRALHFPDDPAQVEKALDRMAFEQMFLLQRGVLEQKQEWQGTAQERLQIPMNVDLIRLFFESLHFTPTDSQKVAIYEILKDMEKGYPMSRLLEGDVGSGKTLVATAVIANVIGVGGQCAFMVPTEVLAKQHVQSIARVLIDFHSFLEKKNGVVKLRAPTVALLTGSLTDKEAKEIKQKLVNGTVDLVIGTHALITETVHFQDLKLVIVDEQHRFGVEQRERLKEKGNPHFLAMTATPIPRTLALTAYGHHDLSVLLEKPGNRQKIHTKVVPPKERKTVEHFIDTQIEEGRQAFVICPLIEESEKEDIQEVKNVQSEVARLKEGFPHRRIASLHGRMGSDEKQKIMKAFKDREFDILVSTSVIEVGIDVPNATIMILEGSERFGLAQLHQFRGRVGRGEHKSYCFLFTTNPAQARSPRLKAMEENDSGFVLAEIDLQIRGPGELFGLRQSGLPDMQLGRVFNPEMVVRARRAAEEFISKR